MKELLIMAAGALFAIAIVVVVMWIAKRNTTDQTEVAEEGVKMEVKSNKDSKGIFITNRYRKSAQFSDECQNAAEQKRQRRRERNLKLVERSKAG